MDASSHYEASDKNSSCNKQSRSAVLGAEILPILPSSQIGDCWKHSRVTKTLICPVAITASSCIFLLT